jgi:hypothetical protein
MCCLAWKEGKRIFLESRGSVMKFKFICDLCKKIVKRGDKFRVEVDQYESESELTGVCSEEYICKSCTTKIERKIESLRK